MAALAPPARLLLLATLLTSRTVDALKLFSAQSRASGHSSLWGVPNLQEKPDWLGEATSWKDTKLEVQKHYDSLYKTCKELREVNAKEAPSSKGEGNAAPTEGGGEKKDESKEKSTALFETLDALRGLEEENDDDDDAEKKEKEEEEAAKKKEEEEAKKKEEEEAKKKEEEEGKKKDDAQEKAEDKAVEESKKEGEDAAKKEKEEKEAAEKAEKEKADKEKAEKEKAEKEKAEKEAAEKAEALNKLKEERVEKYKACVDAVHSWAGVTKGIQELSFEGNEHWKKERDELLAKLKPLEDMASPEGIKALLSSFTKIIPDLVEQSEKNKLEPPPE